MEVSIFNLVTFKGSLRTGSTTSDCLGLPDIFHQPKLRRTAIGNLPIAAKQASHIKPIGLNETRGDSHGLGRFHPKTAFDQGCITVLLLGSVEIGAGYHPVCVIGRQA